mmetsp:Transcript_4844/g.7165  ORF Transcript_4844/g.7165 Transcript_4844/m.7165 type:complete len:257 (+) Transcript_4844:217-987(+)
MSRRILITRATTQMRSKATSLPSISAPHPSATLCGASRCTAHHHRVSSTLQRRSISTTSIVCDKDGGEPKLKVEAASADDECPEYQNPLHHNDPQLNKIMIDDFEPGEEIPFAQLPPLDDGSGKVAAPPHIHELADQIVNMSMLEISELVTRLSEHYGIEPDDMSGMIAGDAGGGETQEEEEKVEKTAFDLKLMAFDAKAKIKIIKEVRAITSLGLKEAKELVEGAPKTIKGDIKMEEAEELKKKLEELGATIEIV